MPFKKGNPGCPCCGGGDCVEGIFGCDDCTDPVPASLDLTVVFDNIFQDHTRNVVLDYVMSYVPESGDVCTHVYLSPCFDDASEPTWQLGNSAGYYLAYVGCIGATIRLYSQAPKTCGTFPAPTVFTPPSPPGIVVASLGVGSDPYTVCPVAGTVHHGADNSDYTLSE